jgi:hypothetical protein
MDACGSTRLARQAPEERHGSRARSIWQCASVRVGRVLLLRRCYIATLPESVGFCVGLGARGSLSLVKVLLHHQAGAQFAVTP